MKRYFLYTLCSFVLVFLSIVANGQNARLGVGAGYNFNSFAGDSLKHPELSLHYRLNDKHTFQLFALFRTQSQNSSFKKTERWDDPGRTPGIQEEGTVTDYNFKYNTKNALWGIGAGYDYAFFSRGIFSTFAGAKLGYQQLKYHNTGVIDARAANIIRNWELQLKGSSSVKEIHHNLFAAPHVGIRFRLFSGLSVEGSYNLSFNAVKKVTKDNFIEFRQIDGSEHSKSSHILDPKKSAKTLGYFSVKAVYFFH